MGFFSLHALLLLLMGNAGGGGGGSQGQHTLHICTCILQLQQARLAQPGQAPLLLEHFCVLSELLRAICVQLGQVQES